jgi:hypothetical protein
VGRDRKKDRLASNVYDLDFLARTFQLPAPGRPLSDDEDALGREAVRGA